MLRRDAAVDLGLTTLGEEVRETLEVRVPVEGALVVSLYRQTSKVALQSRGNPFEAVWGHLTTLWKSVDRLNRVSVSC